MAQTDPSEIKLKEPDPVDQFLDVLAWKLLDSNSTLSDLYFKILPFKETVKFDGQLLSICQWSAYIASIACHHTDTEFTCDNGVSHCLTCLRFMRSEARRHKLPFVCMCGSLMSKSSYHKLKKVIRGQRAEYQSLNIHYSNHQ